MRDRTGTSLKRTLRLLPPEDGGEVKRPRSRGLGRGVSRDSLPRRESSNVLRSLLRRTGSFSAPSGDDSRHEVPPAAESLPAAVSAPTLLDAAAAAETRDGVVTASLASARDDMPPPPRADEGASPGVATARIRPGMREARCIAVRSAACRVALFRLDVVSRSGCGRCSSDGVRDAAPCLCAPLLEVKEAAGEAFALFARSSAGAMPASSSRGVEPGTIGAIAVMSAATIARAFSASGHGISTILQPCGVGLRERGASEELVLDSRPDVACDGAWESSRPNED